MILQISIVTIAFMIAIGSYYWGPFKGEPTNPVEEVANKIISSELNTPVDISVLEKETK